MTRPLPALAAAALLGGAASAQITTIRVEIDYMVDAFHSHQPTLAELDAVVEMFACRGVTLVLDIDDPVPEIFSMECPDPGAAGQGFFTCSGPQSFSSYRSLYRDRGAGWHYCIFVHRYDDGDGTSSSGLGEIGGNDFIVADGVFSGQMGSVYERAATFAHELGHNLGLRHNSPETPILGRGPYAPNLASIMSYQYQLSGVKTRLECLGLVGPDHRFKDIDYSDGSLPPLTELQLFETVGVGIRPVDWNCNGTIDASPASKDLDTNQGNWCLNGGGLGTLYDYDEWANITDNADLPRVLDERIELPYEVCIGPEEARAPGSCPVPDPSGAAEPCASGAMIWVDPSNTGGQAGTGRYPWRHVDFAVLAAPANSVLYLQPGTQAMFNAGPLVVDKKLVLAGPGGAVIDP